MANDQTQILEQIQGLATEQRRERLAVIAAHGLEDFEFLEAKLVDILEGRSTLPATAVALPPPEPEIEIGDGYLALLDRYLEQSRPGLESGSIEKAQYELLSSIRKRSLNEHAQTPAWMKDTPVSAMRRLNLTDQPLVTQTRFIQEVLLPAYLFTPGNRKVSTELTSAQRSNLMEMQKMRAEVRQGYTDFTIASICFNLGLSRVEPAVVSTTESVLFAAITIQDGELLESIRHELASPKKQAELVSIRVHPVQVLPNRYPDSLPEAINTTLFDRCLTYAALTELGESLYNSTAEHTSTPLPTLRYLADRSSEALTQRNGPKARASAFRQTFKLLKMIYPDKPASREQIARLAIMHAITKGRELRTSSWEPLQLIRYALVDAMDRGDRDQVDQIGTFISGARPNHADLTAHLRETGKVYCAAVAKLHAEDSAVAQTSTQPLLGARSAPTDGFSPTT